MAKSKMNTEKGICYLCGRVGYTHKHHCFGGANRTHSERYGLTVYLCPSCHEYGPQAVHNGGRTNIDRLHQEAQRTFEQKSGTREDFMCIFGRNYL